MKSAAKAAAGKNLGERTSRPHCALARDRVKCCHCCQSQFTVSNWQHWYWQLATFTHWQHLHIGFASASAVNPHFFASPAERAVSCGPKGPFVSGGAAWPDRAQGRCDAHGEAKPQAVRRRAFIEVAARRPAARRFSWLRASAPNEMLPLLPIPIPSFQLATFTPTTQRPLLTSATGNSILHTCFRLGRFENIVGA